MPSLNLPWGNTTLSLSPSSSLSISLVCPHKHAHTVADMLTFPDRHLSLSHSVGVKFSLSWETTNTLVHVLHIAPSRCQRSSSQASPQGRISFSENCAREEREGEGESTWSKKAGPPPSLHGKQRPAVALWYDLFPVFSITGCSSVLLNCPQEGEVMLSTAERDMTAADAWGSIQLPQSQSSSIQCTDVFTCGCSSTAAESRVFPHNSVPSRTFGAVSL